MYNIFTYSFNNPTYLEYQIKAFQKFSKEQFNFTCIDNSIDNNIRTQLQNVCKSYNINHQINQTPDHSLAGRSHYSALQWSFNNLIINSRNLCLMIDHDTFPIKYFSIEEILDGAGIAGAPQSREHITYIHPSFMIFDVPKLPNKHMINFNGDKVSGITVDIGGQLYVYFSNNPDVKIKLLASRHVDKENAIIPDDLKSNYTYPIDPFEIIEDKFLHTRLGSNWSHIDKESFEQRNNLIYSMLNRYISQ